MPTLLFTLHNKPTFSCSLLLQPQRAAPVLFHSNSVQQCSTWQETRRVDWRFLLYNKYLKLVCNICQGCWKTCSIDLTKGSNIIKRVRLKMSTMGCNMSEIFLCRFSVGCFIAMFFIYLLPVQSLYRPYHHTFFSVENSASNIPDTT